MHYFIATLLIFPGKKPCLQKVFSCVLCLALSSLPVPAVCASAGILELVNFPCVSPPCFMSL